MLVGSVGTGKTTLVQSFLGDSASDSLLSCTINTSYYTDAEAMQRQLEQPLDKVSRGINRAVMIVTREKSFFDSPPPKTDDSFNERLGWYIKIGQWSSWTVKL